MGALIGAPLKFMDVLRILSAKVIHKHYFNVLYLIQQIKKGYSSSTPIDQEYHPKQKYSLCLYYILDVF